MQRYLKFCVWSKQINAFINNSIKVVPTRSIKDQKVSDEEIFFNITFVEIRYEFLIEKLDYKIKHNISPI
jgi:hypothetical protein